MMLTHTRLQTFPEAFRSTFIGLNLVSRAANLKHLISLYAIPFVYSVALCSRGTDNRIWPLCLQKDK